MLHNGNIGVGAKIEQMICAEMPHGLPHFDVLAARMYMSPQTLSRKLQREGSSYRKIKEQIRRKLSIELLCGSDMTITTIALHLGYTDSSAFHRAFKAWSGISPGKYRCKAKPGSP